MLYLCVLLLLAQISTMAKVNETMGIVKRVKALDSFDQDPLGSVAKDKNAMSLRNEWLVMMEVLKKRKEPIEIVKSTVPFATEGDDAFATDGKNDWKDMWADINNNCDVHNDARIEPQRRRRAYGSRKEQDSARYDRGFS